MKLKLIKLQPVQYLPIRTLISSMICLLSIAPSSKASASEDSLNLAQCYANLSLTVSYFDILPNQRLSKIIPYIDGELSKITDKDFINLNASLYYMAYSHLQFLKTKFMFKNKSQVTRSFLLQCKASLDSALLYKNIGAYPNRENEYYSFVGFNEETYDSLNFAFQNLKDTLALFFNKDIYPDFQRIFYAAKNKEQYYFDSLKYYAGLYDLSLDLFIKENRSPSTIHTGYDLLLPLDLISKFLQFSLILKNKTVAYSPNLILEAFSDFRSALNAKNNTSFGYPSKMPKDDFFRKELNEEVVNRLYEELMNQFKFDSTFSDSDGVGLFDRSSLQEKYYFPIPAPFPSSKYSVNHFAPGLNTLRDVDKYIRKSFYEAGYAGRLHYYYIKYPGFAVTTDIERINKDGSPAKAATRWNLKMSNDGKFTLYKIFRSIFFATESDFRMIACLVAPHEIETDNSREQPGISQIAKIIENSYSSLPIDLENVSLSDKTLTIMVYHFYQSDIGEVPVLSRSNKLAVSHHLEQTSPLERLIK